MPSGCGYGLTQQMAIAILPMWWPKPYVPKRRALNIMIDFHYSDWWADPGKQTKPAAWAGLDFTTLTSTLHDYTKSVMNTLKDNGITPVWVQVGNETNDGMLWEDGRASKNMANLPP
jgi:arabinogalactan endo-1,4-beta-galactosidase